MDIQFIEEKYRDDIFQLMEMTGLNMPDAYELYISSNNNLENAIQMHFAKNDPFQQEKIQQPQFNIPAQQKKLPQYTSANFDEQYERYQIFKQHGAAFGDNYQVRKQEKSLIKSFIPNIFKGGAQTQNAFKKSVQEYTGKNCGINFSVHSLSQTLQEEGCGNKFPVIVHVLQFDKQSKKTITEQYTDSQLLQVINVQFQSFGYDPSKYELQECLAPFLNIPHDLNSFVVFRVNVFNEIERLGAVKLNELSAQGVRKELKLMKNLCIQKQMDQVHLEKRYSQELMGNFNYTKPVSMSEKRKIAEDRAIRKKQEEQFFASMKVQQQKQQQKIQQINKPAVIQDHSKTSQVKKKEVSKEEIEAKRKQMRGKMKMYQEGMMIKLRIPSGESIKLNVKDSQKVSYLYNYVESQEGDCGFENELKRQFDIIRPYDQLNLSLHMNQSLRKVFQQSDMESLAVREKE